jgi:voltage-gated potassium channel
VARTSTVAVESHGVNERARALERRLELPMLAAALLVIPAIAIEQGEAGEPWDAIAVVINWGTWFAFLLEAVLMLRVVDDRWRWVRDHPLEVAIVIVTPPFLPAGLQAARVFRLLRLLPLLRAGVLARRLLTTEGVRDAGVLTLLIVLGGGAAFAAVEKDQHLSTWEGVWWAINTVTTVGYGPAPRTVPGRVIAIVVMLVGIGFIAVLTAAAAERFMRGREAEAQRAELHERLEEIAARLAAMEDRGN